MYFILQCYAPNAKRSSQLSMKGGITDTFSSIMPASKTSLRLLPRAASFADCFCCKLNPEYRRMILYTIGGVGHAGRAAALGNSTNFGNYETSGRSRYVDCGIHCGLRHFNAELADANAKKRCSRSNGLRWEFDLPRGVNGVKIIISRILRSSSALQRR